ALNPTKTFFYRHVYEDIFHSKRVNQASFSSTSRLRFSSLFSASLCCLSSL
ncbi:unnamed protein product, partial [Arabidopsis halleri]